MHRVGCIIVTTPPAPQCVQTEEWLHDVAIGPFRHSARNDMSAIGEADIAYLRSVCSWKTVADSRRRQCCCAKDARPPARYHRCAAFAKPSRNRIASTQQICSFHRVTAGQRREGERLGTLSFAGLRERLIRLRHPPLLLLIEKRHRRQAEKRQQRVHNHSRYSFRKSISSVNISGGLTNVAPSGTATKEDSPGQKRTGEGERMPSAL